jgi:lipopolysaccharide export system protein LptA
MLAALTAWPAGQAYAQDAGSRCTLRVATPPGARSVHESVPDVPDAYVTYIGGGVVTVRCGDAVMSGDSAVNYDHLQQAVMIGNVDYRDSTRELTAGRVTYYGLRDLVIAEEDVSLVRFRTDGRLRGPHVEFFRTPQQEGRTVATGRPRMSLPTGVGRGGEPLEVDADVAEFIGEEQASARGAVEIRRSDLKATADSARFLGPPGIGVLYGDPVVSGEGFDLKGDSVVADFAAGELRHVHSLGDATATGENFELRSEQVRAQLGDGEVERLWAFGEGRSIGVSGRFQLAGDSIDFAFAAGRLDSIAAVGDGTSTEMPERIVGRELEEAELSIEAGSNWVAGDTIRARFQSLAADSAMDAHEDPNLERLVAVGNARSFYATVRDSTRSREPSRNYIIGGSIEIWFQDGEATEVLGSDAIGVYLEPAPDGGAR